MTKKNTSALFYFLVAMLLVATIAARTPADSDMWWHIRSGEETLSTGAPLLTDLFSFTRQGAAWANHSWLAQVIMYFIFRAGGFAGLAIFTALPAVLSMALLYHIIDGPPLLKSFLVIFAAAACSLVWTARPQVFSLLFFAGLYWLLLAFRRKRRAPLWLIPVGFALWSNLHAGFALGLILLAVFLAAEVANRLFFFPEEECLSWKQIGTLGIWSLSALPAVLLNPNGLQTWLIPFQTVGITALQNLIQEWASPDFHVISQQLILWLFFLLVLTYALSGRRPAMVDIILPLSFAYMTFLARRNIAAFAMTAAPALARGLIGVWETWWGRASQDERVDRFLKSPELQRLLSQNKQLNPALSRVVNLLIIAFLGMLAFGRLGVVSLNGVVAEEVRKEYPVQALAWLDEHPVSGNLFNEYNWGGYLIYAHPQNRVFVDGRTDLYGDEVISEWQRALLASPGWEKVLEKWDIRIVLVQPGRPLATMLKERGWRTAYENAGSVLLLKE